MSEASDNQKDLITLQSARFGEMQVPAASIIDIPAGIIGFPHATRYVMLEHKYPVSWLQAVDDPNLAFVVIDGFEIGQQFDFKPPLNDKECDFKEEDEFAILIVVTVRPDPRLTTANLKAPIFVNMRNRRGVQVIFDDPRYSTRFPLGAQEPQAAAGAEGTPEAQGALKTGDAGK